MQGLLHEAHGEGAVDDRALLLLDSLLEHGDAAAKRFAQQVLTAMIAPFSGLATLTMDAVLERHCCCEATMVHFATCVRTHLHDTRMDLDSCRQTMEIINELLGRATRAAAQRQANTWSTCRSTWVGAVVAPHVCSKK